MVYVTMAIIALLIMLIFFEGNWDFLKQDAIAPLTNNKLDKNGTEFIAQEIVNFFSKS